MSPCFVSGILLLLATQREIIDPTGREDTLQKLYLLLNIWGVFISTNYYLNSLVRILLLIMLLSFFQRASLR